jgi:hypothetical protein
MRMRRLTCRRPIWSRDSGERRLRRVLDRCFARERVVSIEANLRRLTLVVGLVILNAVRPAYADSPPPSLSSTASVSTPASAGIAVVGLPGATDAAWSLARSIYAAPSLKPGPVDELRAHVLCGEAVPSGAPADIRDLADTVAALRGDDAPSRALLGDIARRFSAQAVAVVGIDAGRPSARVFLADTGSFDAATYAPDEGSSVSWAVATRSLVRAFGSPGSSRGEPAGAPSRAAGAPVLATHEAPKVESAQPRRREFYESGWFWGALGAAAFAGGAVFLATRDTAPSTIHLQLEVPH